MSTRQSGDWRRALHETFGGQIELAARPKSDPTMIHIGCHDLPPELGEDLAHERQRLVRAGRDNEIQAVLAEPPDFSADPIAMRYRTIEYAAVRTLRRHRAAPLVLSASAFPVCWERRCLYLQRRSPTVDLAPSLLYGFAGAFQPAVGAAGHGGVVGGSLVQTALRELEEETGLVARPDAATPLAMFQDNATAALELVLLGLGLRPEEADRLGHSTEGDVIAVPFDELPQLLRQRDKWTAGGRFVVLAWLMLGFQGLKSAMPMFREQAPQDVFWSGI